MPNRHLHAAGIATVIAIVLWFAPAEASKNDNRFQQSAEATRLKNCDDLQSSYNININYYNGKPSKRGKWKIAADNLKTLAEGNNCTWAQ